jgi:hypothetical protein
MTQIPYELMENPTATIVQGRYDLVCPPQTAYDLHEAWPEATLCWVPDAGHSAKVCARKRNETLILVLLRCADWRPIVACFSGTGYAQEISRGL